LQQGIGRRIRERRRALEISQIELREKLGITYQQIQKYEKGASRISAARLYQVCQILKVSSLYMFEHDPQT
jgi:transcriptional regulator with XRE-family HTH domain